MDVSLLLEMLTYKRPARSKTEERFINKFINTLPGAVKDMHGNVMVQVGESRTLFSAHTDTVHSVGGFQSVLVDKDANHAFVDAKKSNCLGADNTTGCFILINMIEAGVPGTYIFHRDEEVGGIGSNYIAKNLPDGAYDRAIAFDRRGTTDVITHQGFSRCCSGEFANELSIKLGLFFMPSNNGIFTDTANYDHIIPECTNISIGYENGHCSSEYQDLKFLDILIPALLNTKWEQLVTKRDPAATEKDYWDDMYPDEPATEDDLRDLVCEYPFAVAEFLLDNNVSKGDLMNYVFDETSYSPKGFPL